MSSMTNVFISTADAKQRFSKVVNEVYYGEKQFIVTAHGKPKVIITAHEPATGAALPVTTPSSLTALKALQSKFAEQQLSSDDLVIPRDERDNELSDLS